MTNIHDEWRRYKQACYPQGMPAEQYRECHQAFFSGALSALTAMNKLSELPESEAVKALERLQQEVTQTCAARAYNLKAQN